MSKVIGSVRALIVVLLVLSGVVSAQEATRFPAEPVYRALYAQAVNQGYSDIANGVAVFHRYRSGLELCTGQETSASSKEFGEFLDSVVRRFHGYLNANLRSRSVRSEIASYFTQCSALIEIYARNKASRFNGGPTRLDAQDESLVATTRQLHGQLGSLLRVGAPSVDGTIAQWSNVDWSQWLRDGRFGHAASSILKLNEKGEAYCKVQG